MTYTNWQAILNVIRNTVENTCADGLNTELKYADNLIMSDNLAASIFNGSYFIRLQGITKVDDTVNGRFQPEYIVTTELCYQISAGNSVDAYNSAVEDIEVILKNILNQTSWEDYTDNIQYIRLNNIGEPKYTLKGEIFMIIPIQLTFTLISLY